MLSVRERATEYNLRKLEATLAGISPTPPEVVEIDFGPHPGSTEVNVAIADSAASGEAWARFTTTPTTDHSAFDHRYVPLFVSLLVDVAAGVGVTIHAASEHKLEGRWNVVWGYR